MLGQRMVMSLGSNEFVVTTDRSEDGNVSGYGV
nr:MAG TPA: hypothetical protein [Caudoviricetes sp.]